MRRGNSNMTIQVQTTRKQIGIKQAKPGHWVNKPPIGGALGTTCGGATGNLFISPATNGFFGGMWSSFEPYSTELSSVPTDVRTLLSKHHFRKASQNKNKIEQRLLKNDPISSKHIDQNSPVQDLQRLRLAKCSTCHNHTPSWSLHVFTMFSTHCYSSRLDIPKISRV